jgi:hypothetical protein
MVLEDVLEKAEEMAAIRQHLSERLYSRLTFS